MNEEKTTQEKSEETGANSNTGISNAGNPIGIIERAEAAAKKNEEILKRIEEANIRTEMLMAKQRMDGKADAGIPPVPEKVMTNIEKAQALLKGNFPNPLK